MALNKFVQDPDGVAAIEFALLAPAFLMLLIGTITVSMLLFTASGLHFDGTGQVADPQGAIIQVRLTPEALHRANQIVMFRWIDDQGPEAMLLMPRNGGKEGVIAQPRRRGTR